MANVYDVAKYILSLTGDGVTAMKLQKLVYYSQAWSLAWLERPLFQEPIEAWAGGPVCPALYGRHRGQFMVSSTIVEDGHIEALDEKDRDTIGRVVAFYGQHTAQWLSDLTHLEKPWLAARERAHAGPGEQCGEAITLADMYEYYSGLMSNASAQIVS